MDILIVTPRAAFWEGKKGVFEKYGADLRMVPAMPEALDSLKEKKAALALLDLFGGEAWNSEIHASAMKKAVITVPMPAMVGTCESFPPARRKRPTPRITHTRSHPMRTN